MATLVESEYIFKAFVQYGAVIVKPVYAIRYYLFFICKCEEVTVLMVERITNYEVVEGVL